LLEIYIYLFKNSHTTKCKCDASQWGKQKGQQNHQNTNKTYSLTGDYSNSPCEKPLMERVLLKQA